MQDQAKVYACVLTNISSVFHGIFRLSIANNFESCKIKAMCTNSVVYCYSSAKQHIFRLFLLHIAIAYITAYNILYRANGIQQKYVLPLT